MEILNLYSGIGGNRKLWGNEHNITAVEIDEEIANIYTDFFPEDEMIVGDAHKYLRNNFENYDVIWSSPPCPSHSKVRMMASKAGSYKPIFPDCGLWQEIIFLEHFLEGKYCVENVKPYYKPVVEPTVNIGRHYFWSNFNILSVDIQDGLSHNERGMNNKSFFDLSDYNIEKRKDQILRNCVKPELGKHILDCAIGKVKQSTLSW